MFFEYLNVGTGLMSYYLKKAFALAIIVSLFSGIFSPRPAHAVGLGPFDVTKSFCMDVQKVGNILNAFQSIQWPVVGIPGIAVGATFRTSVVVDMCQFIMNLEQLNTLQGVLYSANYLNELTGKKWDDHLKKLDQTWNLANSVYDFQKGTFRKGALLGTAAKRANEEWKKSVFGQAANNITSELMMSLQIEQNELEQAAYKRSLMKEAINCPKPPESINYQNIYTTQIKPIEDKRDHSEEDMSFYRKQLTKLAERFVNSAQEVEEFNSDVEKAMSIGVAYSVSPKTRSETTYKPSTSKVDSSGHPDQESVSLKRPISVYSVQTNQQAFTQFKEKWEPRWLNYVDVIYDKAGQNGAEDPLNDDMAALSDECNMDKIMRSYPKENGNYNLEYDKQKKQCRDKQRMNHKKAANLLNMYTTRLAETEYLYKKSNAELWTKDSYYLGVERVITKNNQSGIQSEDVVCKEKMTPAEMQKLELENMAVSNALNEIIAKQTFKQTVLEEEKTRAIREENKTQSQRRQLLNRKSDNLQDSVKDGFVPNSVKGGI